jgi:hypothetical protein
LGKLYGIKCEWLKEQLRAWGISREHDENMLGTHWEQGRKTKNASPPLPPKGKNRAHHECMLRLLIGCMKFLFPKLFVTIFGLG